MRLPPPFSAQLRSWQISIAEAGRTMRHHPVGASALALVIALVLFTGGGIRLAGENFSRLAASWSRGAQVIVYLDDGVAPARLRQIADSLAQLGGVEAVRTIDAKEAHARLRRSLGDRARLLEGVEETMLPTSLEIAFRQGQTAAELGPVAERIRRVAGVEDVELLGDLLERTQATQRLLAAAWAWGGSLLLLVGLLLVLAIARLGSDGERPLTDALRLAGASRGFRWRPAALQALVTSTIGWTLGTGLLYSLYRAARPAAEHALGTTLTATPLAFLSGGTMALAWAIGLLLALVACGLNAARDELA